MGWIIILAIGAVVILAKAVTNHYKKKRVEAFSKRAESLGLDFYTDLEEQDWDRIEASELYQKYGRSQRVGIALVAETQTTRITLCDYTYDVGTGKNKSSQTSVVAIVTDRRLSIPQLTLVQRNWKATLAKLVGYRYIEFQDDPDFNARYLVSSSSEDPVREYLTISRRKRLVETPVESLEGLGSSFILVNAGVWLKTSEIENRLSQALAVLKAVL